MRTLREVVRFYPEHDCFKHDLAPDAEEYATGKINEMSNSEFLDAISNALEELLEPK